MVCVLCDMKAKLHVIHVDSDLMFSLDTCNNIVGKCVMPDTVICL